MQDGEENIKPSRKNRFLKKVLKIISYIVLGVAGLNVLIYILLSIPAVQERVICFMIDEIRPVIKTEISIDKVHLGLFNHVNLQGVYIEDQKQDTLLYAKELDVKFNLWNLFFDKLQINSVVLDHAVVNVSQANPDSAFNFQFLIDAFAKPDTVPKLDSNPLKIDIGSINIRKARVNYDVLSEVQTPDMFNILHMAITDLDAELGFDFTNLGNFSLSIEALALKEKTGLTVINLEGDVQVKDFAIESEKIKLELPSSKLEVVNVKYSLISNKFGLQLNSNVQPSDLLFFVPQLKSLKNEIVLNSNISGKLPSFNLEQFVLNYGEDLLLDITASIDNLRDYSNAKANLMVNTLRVSPEAIVQLVQIGDSSYANPAIFSLIDYFYLNGSMSGKPDNMKVDINAWTKQGALQLVGNVATDSIFDDFKAKAALKTQNFNLAPFAGENTKLKNIDMHVNVDISSVKNLTLQFDGAIDALQYKERTLKNFYFGGKYGPSEVSTWLNSSLSIGQISAEASLTKGQNTNLKFDVDVSDLLIGYFYENPEWKNPKLTFCLNGDLTGNDVNNMWGKVILDSLKLCGDNLYYEPGKFILKSGMSSDTVKYISLKTPLLNASIMGQYDLISIVPELETVMHVYLPGLFAESKFAKVFKNKFDIDILVKNTEYLGQLFALPADVIDSASIKGTVNTIDNYLNLKGNFPFVRYGEQEIKNATLNINNSLSSINFNAKANLPQNSGFVGVNVDATIANDTVSTLLTVRNNDSPIDVNGQLDMNAHFKYEERSLVSYLNLLPTDLNVGLLNLSILPASIVNGKEKTTVSNAGFSLNGKKFFGVDGVISSSKDDSLHVYFNHAQIGDFLTAFDVNSVKADANGGLIVTGILDQPQIYTNNLSVSDIVVFGDTLGSLDIQSEWNNIQQAINFQVLLNNNISTSNVKGTVSTLKDSMNIDLALEKLPIRWVQFFVPDMLNKTSGTVSAKMVLDGKPTSPIANGWVGFNDVYIGVNYTNVTYHISDTIRVLPDKIGFRRLEIEDNNKNVAVANALVEHMNFRDFKYILTLDFNNFMILNTENRTDSLFYGKLMASGNTRVEGSKEKIDVIMKVKSERNSNINITLPNVSEAVDYQGIVYINVPQEKSERKTVVPVHKTALPLNLDMDIDLTSNIALGIVINPVTGDAMQVKGTGRVKFDYDMQANNMDVRGEYVLSDGNVKLKLQNLATLEFKIQEGSKLNFIGDPMRTTFDITAYRRVRANLQNLDESFSSSSRVNVDCVLGIKGNIRRMDLTYDIILPDADDDIRRKVQSLISTDDDKIKNFASLIAIGAFYSSGDAGTGFTNNMLTNVASGALSGILNATFGNILGDRWEIGTDISSQDGSFSDVDMTVSVSTRLFDDKLRLNTNLGYRTEQTTAENTFVGDFDIEYELTRLWKLKVYNKTNDQFYKQAATTQGIGIIYTKEAKTLRQLFRSFRRRQVSKPEK